MRKRKGFVGMLSMSCVLMLLSMPAAAHSGEGMGQKMAPSLLEVNSRHHHRHKREAKGNNQVRRFKGSDNRHSQEFEGEQDDRRSGQPAERDSDKQYQQHHRQGASVVTPAVRTDATKKVARGTVEDLKAMIEGGNGNALTYNQPNNIGGMGSASSSPYSVGFNPYLLNMQQQQQQQQQSPLPATQQSVGNGNMYPGAASIQPFSSPETATSASHPLRGDANSSHESKKKMFLL
eukprot:jgi/Bigna1/141393/aug1.62_g16101